ncbi:RNA-directed DNA polymerase [Streptococcus dysgalactiae subsp. equisimilis]|nr:reverse transcriptase family protein [Streptococcus dysgalactiae]MBM6549230.1 RNA-directed DNA polymerase [Streptococcus dysgalactiae subsp. equisimilis]
MVTESWCSETLATERISITGFDVFRKDRPIGRGGGCVVYANHSLRAEVLHHPILDKVLDAVWLSCPLEHHTLIIGCIYRPPGHNFKDLELVIDAFDYVAQLPPGPKLIAGDFNVPGINWPNLTAPQNLLNFVSCVRVGRWTQHITSPTRVNNILDLLFTIDIPNVSASVLDRFPGSDHHIVTCIFEVSRPSKQPPVKFASFHLANWSNLSNLIRVQNWDEFFLTDDPQHAASVLYHNLATCISLITPSPPTFRPNISAATRLQRKLRKLQREYAKTRDFSLVIRVDHLNRLIDSETETRHKKQERAALVVKNRTQQLAKLLKNRNSPHSPKLSYYISPDKTSLESPEDISEAFNDYFANSLITDPHPFQHNSPCTPVTSAVLSNISFSLNEIVSLLSSGVPNFHPGPDGLPSATFWLGGPDIPLFLLKLFNLSMVEGIFPSQWKMSTIIPCHKKGSIHEIINYRPINHTPAISRIMERIIKRQLSDFLVSHNLIHDSQHGFLKTRSCTTCHYEFLNFVTSSADNGQALIVIFLDMSKAFDRVSHRRLLAKVLSYGVSGTLHSWLTSYLSMRKQAVFIDGYLSQPRPVTSGVVQGSVLGPLLFLMYVNDIFSTIHHGKPFLFADDIKIVYSFPPQNLTATLLDVNRDLLALDSWCKLWLMNFSADKSSFISYKCHVPLNAIRLNGLPISANQVVKDLGLQYSGTFTFAEQAVFQVSKAKRTIGLIHKSFRLQYSKLLLYKSHVRSQLEYSSIVFSNMNKNSRIAFENVQRTFTKQLIGYSSPLNYRQRCELLNLEPLWIRRLKLNLCFLFNLIHFSTHSSSSRPAFSTHHLYSFRNKSCTLPIPRSKHKLRSHFFLVVYSRLWNKLPQSVRSCSTLSHFKLALSKFLIVPLLIQVTNAHLTIDRAYEIGLEF